MIGTVLDHLRLEDLELLLANRGLPSAGGKEELTDRLQCALQDEICQWEWESGDVPEFHCGRFSPFFINLHPLQQMHSRLFDIQTRLSCHNDFKCIHDRAQMHPYACKSRTRVNTHIQLRACSSINAACTCYQASSLCTSLDTVIATSCEVPIHLDAPPQSNNLQVC